MDKTNEEITEELASVIELQEEKIKELKGEIEENEKKLEECKDMLEQIQDEIMKGVDKRINDKKGGEIMDKELEKQFTEKCKKIEGVIGDEAKFVKVMNLIEDIRILWIEYDMAYDEKKIKEVK